MHAFSLLCQSWEGTYSKICLFVWVGFIFFNCKGIWIFLALSQEAGLMSHDSTHSLRSSLYLEWPSPSSSWQLSSCFSRITLRLPVFTQDYTSVSDSVSFPTLMDENASPALLMLVLCLVTALHHQTLSEMESRKISALFHQSCSQPSVLQPCTSRSPRKEVHSKKTPAKKHSLVL